jgi:L-rhamnose mutarotase
LQRVCFMLQVRPDRVEEYRRRHADVWPEMRRALQGAGWRNYSLFLAEGGTVIGYLECENFDVARAAMEASEVNGRWQTEMAPLFELAGRRPDEVMAPLPEIFHLD